MSQLEKVKRHLEENKEITSWEAIQLYHITRLSDIIFRLRKQFNIGTIYQTNKGNSYAKYVLQESSR